MYLYLLFIYFTSKPFTEFILKINNSIIMRNNQVNNNLIQLLNNEVIKNQRLESEIKN